VDETGVPVENHGPAQATDKLYHTIQLYRILLVMARIELTTYIGRYETNYH
jgi:hypothetical protein